MIHTKNSILGDAALAAPSLSLPINAGSYEALAKVVGRDFLGKYHFPPKHHFPPDDRHVGGSFIEPSLLHDTH